jgi:membrane protein required for beta-lactamase induction
VSKPPDESATPLQTNKPSLGSLLLALIPFLAMCFSVPLWDRVTPLLLGLPFNMCWLILWIVLSSLCLAAIYLREARRAGRSSP